MAKNDEIAVPQKSSLPDLISSKPAYLKELDAAPRGAEQVGADDVSMPRLVICQANTEQRKKQNPKHIPGLDEGMLFNSLTGQVYGTSVTFTPLFFFKNYIRFKPMDQGGGVLCKSQSRAQCQTNNNGPCPFQNWGPNGEPPECTELFNFPALLLPSKELIVISFKSTGVEAAKQLNSFIRFRNADAFAGTYILTAVPDSANGQDFYKPAVANLGWADPELHKFAEAAYEALYAQFAANKLNVDLSGEGREVRGRSDFGGEKVPF